jgi:hypothetical protein
VRAYTAATAAFTLRVPVKWVDNVLSHHRIPGVTQARQGIARRLTLDSIVALAVALRLSTGMRASIGRSLEVAASLSREGHYDLDESVAIEIDVRAIRSELIDRLTHAVETVPVPRRGRPRG